MSLRVKTLLSISITLIALFVLLYLSSRTFYLERFSKLEQDLTIENMERVQNVLRNRLMELERITVDYGVWDDTYNFVTDPIELDKQEYLQSNYSNETFMDNTVHYVVIFNDQNRPLFSKGVSSDGTNLNNDYLFVNELKKYPMLFNQSVQDNKSGIIQFENQPILVSASPILKSNGSGSAKGTLVMARLLDNSLVSILEDTINMKVEITHFLNNEMSDDFRTAREQLSKNMEVSIQHIDSEITAYSFLKDINNQPISLIKINSERTVYNEAQDSLIRFFFIYLVIGLVFSSIIFYLIERVVLKKISNLSFDVQRVRKQQSFSSRLQETELDEIGLLIHNLNHMLSDLERFQKESKISSQTLEFVTNSIDDLVFLTDLNGNIQYVNNSIYRYIGLLPEMALGKSIFSGPIFKEDFNQIEQTINKIITNQKSAIIEFRITDQVNGEVIWLEALGKVVYTDDEAQLLIVARDITNRKHATKQLEEAKVLAEKANEAKSKFVSSMSHELRTPLNAILGFAQLLRFDTKNELNSSQKENVDEIEKAGHHLLRLINEILDLAKIESGQFELTIQTTNVRDVLKEAVSLVEPLAKSREINVILDSPTNEILIEVDPFRLKQVFINLLSNGVKYNRPNGELVIEVEKNANEVSICFADSGYGMSNEELQSIFKPFSRLQKHAHSIEGTGIGLTVSKELIKKMGGKLEVTSKVNDGTRFSVIFPL